MAKPRQPGSTSRLLEIIGILRKHKLFQGLTPEKLRAIVEDLGPTFVKIGQMMSLRPDVLPFRYCEELQKLRSEATPMPAEEVRRVIEASLGVKLEIAFPVFDPTPLGSASIAQVHLARLPGGQKVAVKVQREGIYEMMQNDIALLRKAARLLRLAPTAETVDFNMVLTEMWSVSQQEMDFINEADNAQQFRKLNQNIAYVACPLIYRSVSAKEVLVMEAIDGCRIDDRPALAAQGYDLNEIATKLCHNYMKQILDDGFFHADPHPGNLFIRDGQIVWLDLGMMGTLSPKDQAAFKKALAAVAARDIGGVTEAVLAISKHTAPIRREALYADIDTLMGQYLEMDIGTINLGELLQQVLELAQKNKLALPPGVTVLGRGVSTLEGLISDIAPTVNLMEILTRRYAHEALRDIDWKQTLLRSSQSLYESLQKSLSTPALLNDALRAALKGELKLRLETVTPPAMEQAQANRTDSLRRTALSAALFIGSSLMTLSSAQPLWLGLPWISVVGFALTASVAAFTVCARRKKRR